MADGMTTFELQQEVDKILNRAEELSLDQGHSANVTDTQTVLDDEVLNTGAPTKPMADSSNKRQPVKFKVKKVVHDNEGSTNLNAKMNKSKEFKSVQLKYDQHVNRMEKIRKEIDFLKGLLPPHNFEVDFHTRMKINRAIEKLNMKLDELDKEKYRLGITLSRLWRGYDDSDIWVRSVSG